MRKIFLLIITLQIAFAPIAWAIPFRGSKLVMSAASPAAVRAAQKIAELGGNPVDVAVTIALGMGVTNPTFATLGGGGFAIVKMGKSIEVLDFRERAPQATSPTYYKGKPSEASVTGGAAVGVPGLPAGLWELHKKYGKLHWSRLFDEAINLSEKGFRVSGELSQDMAYNATRFNADAKRHFLKEGTTAYAPGEILVQKGLAKVLREMRNRNITSFYSGPVAKDIVASVQKAGGDMTLKDLSDYRPIWRQPITTDYAGYKLYLLPPPSSGGIVAKVALKLIEQLNLKKYPERGVDEYHLLSEIFSRAYRGRTMIADPDHSKVPVAFLTGKKYVDELAESIQLKEGTQLKPLTESEITHTESAETTHLSVMDKFGNAVAMTITLNGDFGAGVATEKFGIMLNNEMDDFTTQPNEPNMFGLIQGQANVVAPGKRPLSSMTPTLVEKNGKVIMALGAPGGPRIISAVVQTLYRTLGRGQPLEAAVEAPRVHHQFMPNKIYIDENRFSPEVLDGLKARKHSLEESWPARIFAVRNIDGVLEAVVDTRAEGLAGGL